MKCERNKGNGMTAGRQIAILMTCVTLTGCVQMRDYVGAKEGAFGVDIKKGFGRGEEKKEYIMVEEGCALVVGDTKKEVIQKIGTPESVDTTIEGYECWRYREKGIEIFFKTKKLYGWRML